MFFNFKRPVLSQKRQVLLALSFGALFSLFLSSASFATPKEEFAELETQLTENTITPNQFLEAILKVDCPSDNLEYLSYRKILVERALEK